MWSMKAEFPHMLKTAPDDDKDWKEKSRQDKWGEVVSGIEVIISAG